MKNKKVVVLTEQEFLDYLKKSIGKIKNNLKDFSIKDLFSDKKKEEQPKSRGLGGLDFNGATNKIIDLFEGGYYHPDMLQDGRIKDSRYSRSGETLFGIDRLRSASKADPSFKEFWRIVDKQNARKNWSWNYKLKDNPALAKRLKNLVADIMEPQFLKYQNAYLTPKAKQRVNSNPKLFYNFAYATWNGPGWFKKFASEFNEQIGKNKTDDELVDFVINQRKNSGSSLIAQTGAKLEKLFAQMG